MDIQKIVAQHPESVALSFLKYDITAPVTEKSLTAAIVAKGEPFIDDLSNILGNQVEVVENWDGVLGIKLKKKTNPALKKSGRLLNEKIAVKKIEKQHSAALPIVSSINAASPVRVALQNALNHTEIVALNSETQEPRTEAGREVAATAKKGFLDKLSDILGKVKDTSENAKAIFAKPDVTDPAPEKNEGEKAFNKMIVIAVVIVVVLLSVLFYQNPSSPKTVK